MTEELTEPCPGGRYSKCSHNAAATKEDHTCPYGMEMYDDTTPCKCCEECQTDCHYSV